jgi:hypothetical protein
MCGGSGYADMSAGPCATEHLAIIDHCYPCRPHKMTSTQTELSPEDLIRTLRKGKHSDDLGRKIGKALALIEGVLDDMGWVDLFLIYEFKLISLGRKQLQFLSMVERTVGTRCVTDSILAKEA